MEASITLKKVGKLAGDKTILAGLTFGVEKGSMVAIIGDNDAGKSTLLRVMAGFENPEFGSVFIHGLDSIKRRREIRSMVGYVPLESDLDPWLTLDKNIRCIGYFYGINDHTINNRISKYNEVLKLDDFLNVQAGELSPGIQKKGMLVRALIHDPSVLILDEPTAFMDATSNRQTWDLLNTLKQNKTVIYVSHVLSEVEQSHDRILILHHGKVILDGSLDKLLESTLDFNQFQIEFEELSDDLYNRLIKIPGIVTPSKLNNIFHFYGRSRAIFFKVLTEAHEIKMNDLNFKKLGLKDLLDSQFARKGLDG
ncbi:MAG: ABC transporter ATP-binding protein [Candidatus Marinimicrobia bacterium]|nr:ABC transporter ATP-binding protein [Candidatus Neomarinimicrobiota bacterium]